MKVSKIPQVEGALLIIPDVYPDERGYFCFASDTSLVPAASFSQYCTSHSFPGVTRGLHMTRGRGAAKLVRCTNGTVYDVIVDLRPRSPTYRRWVAHQLSGDTCVSVYIPPGCAHGYQVTEGPADITYRIDGPYSPVNELIIACDDPDLKISWPLSLTYRSPQDKAAPRLADAERLLGER